MGIDLKNWMQNLPDGSDLLALNLCGTHDCVTQHIRLPHFFCCQDLTVYEQLLLGVRALDIRVRADGKCLTMVHGIFPAYNHSCHRANLMDMGDVLSQCYRFLDECPGEAVVFQFKNDNGKENEQCFDNLFYTYIKGKEPYWYLEDRVPTLGAARGKLVLIRRCKMEPKPDFTRHNTGIDFSTWVEQPEVIPTALPLCTGTADFIIQDRFKYKPKPRWAQVIVLRAAHGLWRAVCDQLPVHRRWAERTTAQCQIYQRQIYGLSAEKGRVLRHHLCGLSLPGAGAEDRRNQF